MTTVTAENETVERDNLFRVDRRGIELRTADDGGMPTLFGHFAVFDEWTEIDSIFEGRFMESLAPGAFKKTFREQRSEMKVLFNHGREFVQGDKPLGPIETLEEDEIGARYSVPLFDAPYVRELVPGLEADQYGASFRFQVMREDINNEPEKSDYNPDGIPERTIKEARVLEFGPVTFPAYASATAGVRSLTDEFNIFDQLGRDPERARQLLGGTITRAAPLEHPEEKDNDGAAEASHPVSTARLERRVTLERSPTWRLP